MTLLKQKKTMVFTISMLIYDGNYPCRVKDDESANSFIVLLPIILCYLKLLIVVIFTDSVENGKDKRF
jgi:hypothetical protein